jgi:uncharacterized membrane protein YdbT with pleckstrin-like domain
MGVVDDQPLLQSTQPRSALFNLEDKSMAKSYLDSLLGEREQIQHVARQHWFILLRSIALEIFTILVMLAAIITSVILLPKFLLITFVVGFVLLLIPIVSMIHDVLIYTHHEYIVTNRRVIQISGILNKQVIDSSLEKVNDVKMAQSALGRIFNYGDVEILTASELGVNLFRRIENPVQFKTSMLNAKARLESGEHWDAPTPAAPDNVPALLAQLAALHQQGVLTDEEFQQKKAQLLTKI